MRRGLAGARRSLAVAAAALACCLAAAPADAQSLRGSPATVERQNSAAREHDFTFLRDADHVRRFVDAGYLVRVRGNEDFRLKRPGRFPYARPEVRLFLRRLGRQYRTACGEQLVVTSLTRPSTRQPWNASPRSVHPTGMAVDLRRSTDPACRRWLEGVLLHLEGRGVVEAVRERRPPHYHVAVFPKPYVAHVASLGDEETAVAAAAPRRPSGDEAYRIRSGDSLWGIARRFGTTPRRLKDVNGLRGDRIYPGRLLRLP